LSPKGGTAWQASPRALWSFGCEGLWLLNKPASLQLEHFNKSNALGWALTMGAVLHDRDLFGTRLESVMGDSYYIQLGPQDRRWTEPTGHVYQIAADTW